MKSRWSGWLAVVALAAWVVAPAAASAVDEVTPTIITTAALAVAGSVDPHNTAAVGEHRYRVGLFSPLAIRLGERLELQGHPLLFLVAPNALLRVGLAVRPGGWAIATEYGLSIPTVSMRLAQGYLFPSWARGGGTIGWAAAPRAGVLFGRMLPAEVAVTLKADLTAGIPITHSDAMPLDAPAPLNLLMAPVLTGVRARVGALGERALGNRVHLRVYGDLYLHGRTPILEPPAGPTWSNLTTRLGIGVDVLLGQLRLNRITLGAAWWNSDQHEIDEVTFGRVRTNEFWPTLDFVWAG